MLVVTIADGSMWTLLAVCGDDFSCDVLDFIGSVGGARAERIRATLEQRVVNSSPQEWARTDLSKALKGEDGLFEFRWPTRRGGTPRIIWFYGKDALIVCAVAEDKRGQLDRTTLARARAAKARYEAAVNAGICERVTVEELDRRAEGRA